MEGTISKPWSGCAGKRIIDLKAPAAQFWDSSALVSLVIKEKNSPAAKKALDSGTLMFAWDWIRLETHAALTRRGAAAPEFRSLTDLLALFQTLSIRTADFPDIQTLLSKHRLRTADGGHLYCLLKAKKLTANLTFVCFDDELVQAAVREGVKVFA